MSIIKNIVFILVCASLCFGAGYLSYTLYGYIARHVFVWIDIVLIPVIFLLMFFSAGLSIIGFIGVALGITMSFDGELF